MFLIQMEANSDLQRLLERVDGNAPEDAVPFSGVTHDSRQVLPGMVFVALPGLRTDGHRYLVDAVRRGAAALVVENEVEEDLGLPVLRVPNARLALSKLADALSGEPSARLRVTGITGTNGKTTVAIFLKQLLEACDRRSGVVGTIGYDLGGTTLTAPRTTPEAPVLHDLLARMERADCQDAVMEVSSHSLVQHRVEDVRFRAAVFTNLTQDHLDYHQTMDKYYAAKASLFNCRSLEHRIIGVDDAYGRTLASQPGSGDLLTYGFSDDAGVRAILTDEDMSGTRGLLVVKGEEWPFHLSTPGRHNVQNLLAALSTALAYGCPCDTLIHAISSLIPARGRMEIVPSRVGRVVVDYAHTPDAVRRVTTTLRRLTNGRLIVVVGCGGDRDRSKRREMFEAARGHADQVIVTLDNPRTEDPNQIVADMLSTTSDPSGVDVVLDREDAILAGLAELKEDDVLLIAGKGHEETQDFGDRLVPFSDRDVVMNAYRNKGGGNA